MEVAKKDIEGLVKFSRLADYLSAAQIFLQDNFLLERELQPEDIKPRLLGHWGTTPGIAAVFAQVLRQARDKKEFDFLYIVGPGHGFPGFQAGLFIEGSLSYFYPKKIPFSKEGIAEIVRGFSAPYKYPSHLNPEAPGVILEGGELGYSLSYAYGAVLDEPKLIAFTLVGDGEAETGPLSGSWQANKITSPAKDGAVVPILHLNGYKISGPTIYGRMSKNELENYFAGLGYEPVWVEADSHESLHSQLAHAMDKVIEKIKLIKTLAKSSDFEFTKTPMIIMKTPKGLGGPKSLDGRKIEGNSESHQVVFKDLKNNLHELKTLQRWLESYKIDELIDFKKDGQLILDKDIVSLFPEQSRRIGTNPYAHRGYQPLKLENVENLTRTPKHFAEKTDKDTASVVGEYFSKLYGLNKNNFRLFSPDETYSNHLDAVFEKTSRCWQLKIKDWDKDLSKDGRVFELLSEHTLAGMLMGYTLTGRAGFFASYEAFALIVASMVDQYIKFIKVAKDVPFRKPVPSLNILLTSLLERQDHNGFSHQNPSFVSNLFNHDFDLVDIYFPADANVALYSLKRAMQAKNKVSVFVLGKRMKRIFTTPSEAKKLTKQGIGVFGKISDSAPDFVIATIGDYVTQEAVFGVSLVREWFEDARIRFVNVLRPNIFELSSTAEMFRYFTADKPVLFHYHGYANTIEKLIYQHIPAERTTIHGYKESGSTTTPFDMLARNNWTRYDILKFAAKTLYQQKKIDRDRYVAALEFADCKLSYAKEYAIKHLDDPEELKA